MTDRDLWRSGAPGRVMLAVLLLVLAGCATPAPHRQGRLADLARSADPGIAVCAKFWQSLEDAIDRAGVRDAQDARLPGFPWLRASRPIAGLWRTPGADRAALAREMATLDSMARHAELANLPPSERVRLVLPGTGDPTVEASVDTCRARLSDAADTTTLPAPEVPDDYQTWKRVAGVYGLVRYPFAAGVARYQDETVRTFALPVARLPVAGKLTRYAIGADAMITDSGSVPSSFDAATLQAIRAHAPVFEIDVADDHDRPGYPLLGSDELPGADVERPTLFVRTTSQVFAGERLRQVVYGLWFPARPRDGALDLLGGRLDGLLWRVTLDAEGRPLLYDSIHPCGCYHQFFPTPAVRVRPAPDPVGEWAFVPQALPEPRSGARVVLRVAARTHFLQRVSFEDDPRAAEPLALAADDVLRSLPRPGGGRRSLFGPDGIVHGTQRGERWLFWPMGIREPGAMRQWGRHATAFVGRRHFDDADLLDRHFEPVR